MATESSKATQTDVKGKQPVEQHKHEFMKKQVRVTAGTTCVLYMMVLLNRLCAEPTGWMAEFTKAVQSYIPH